MEETINKLTIIILLTISSIGQSQNLEKLAIPLQNDLQQLQLNDYADVLIYLSDQIDLGSFLIQMNEDNFRKIQRSHAIISELQSIASSSQSNLISFLNQQGSSAQNTQSFWIINVIRARLTKQLIFNLTYRSDISIIYRNDLTEPDNITNFSIPGVPPSGNYTQNLISIGADLIHNLGINGSGSLLMNIDQGVNYQHSALSSQWKGNHGYAPSECWFDPAGGSIYPVEDKHGNNTMGIMLGNTPGLTIGVAPGAQWISAKKSSYSQINELLLIFEWALNPDNNLTTSDDIPDVINCSFSISSQEDYECRFDYAGYLANLIKNIEATGTAVVFSAGNSGPDPQTIKAPKNIQSVFCVGNINTTLSNYQIYSESSRGPSKCDGLTIKPEIVAPGVNIFTVSSSGSPYNGYSYETGTSMSGPHVSGAIALLKSAFPEKTGVEIREVLIKTATPYGNPVPNNDYGAGMINLWDAYQYLLLDEIDFQIRQKFSDGTDLPSHLNYLGRWNGTYFNSITANSTIRSRIESIEILKGAQYRYNNEKYKNWLKGTAIENSIENHHIFAIGEGSNVDHISQFDEVQNASLLAVSDGASTGGGLQIKDPWLPDFPEYNSLRNRGMNAIWTTVSSGEHGNLWQSPFNGVFINLVQPPLWIDNFYKIKAPTQLTINSLPSQFLNWSVSSGTVQFQNSESSSEMGIDFETADAVVHANYKASLASLTTGWVTGNQFVSNTGLNSVMYKSNNQLWVHRENGSDWKEIKVNDNAGSILAYSVAPNSNDRYWVTINGTTTATWGSETGGSVYSGNLTLAALPSGGIELVRLSATKLAVIYKNGSTIWYQTGTISGTMVSWGGGISLTGMSDPVQVSTNNSTAYVTWLHGSSVFSYRLTASGVSAMKQVCFSSSGSFSNLASTCTSGGNLEVLARRTNTITSRKELIETAWYTNNTTKPLTVLAIAETYGDHQPVSYVSKGTKKLAVVKSTTYIPNYSYNLWRHNGTEWLSTLSYPTTGQKLLQGDVDNYPAEFSHSSGLKLLQANPVSWPPPGTEKISSGTDGYLPTLSVAFIDPSDTITWTIDLNPESVDSIRVNPTGQWVFYTTGLENRIEILNDLKQIGRAGWVDSSKTISFWPDTLRYDFWVVDPTGNKVRAGKLTGSTERKTLEFTDEVSVHPNPFNPETLIRVHLAQSNTMTVHIYNVLGQLVATLADGSFDIGDYQFRFNGSHLSSGTYFYRVEIGETVKTGKLQLMK